MKELRNERKKLIDTICSTFMKSTYSFLTMNRNTDSIVMIVIICKMPFATIWFIPMDPICAQDKNSRIANEITSVISLPIIENQALWCKIN